MSVLSDRLRALRGSQSQSDMANQLGMKQPQWARYENGSSSPGVDILEKICRIHSVSADWLLGLKDDYNKKVIGRQKPSCTQCPYKREVQKLLKAMKGVV